MRERFANHLAEIEQLIEAALLDAAGMLPLVAEAVLESSDEAIEAIAAAAVRLRSSSHRGDAALVIVSAR